MNKKKYEVDDGAKEKEMWMEVDTELDRPTAFGCRILGRSAFRKRSRAQGMEWNVMNGSLPLIYGVCLREDKLTQSLEEGDRDRALWIPALFSLCIVSVPISACHTLRNTVPALAFRSVYLRSSCTVASSHPSVSFLSSSSPPFPIFPSIQRQHLRL